MPVAMAKSGLQGYDDNQDRGLERGLDSSPFKLLHKEPSYYMDNYAATVTVHTSPPQQQHQPGSLVPQLHPTSGEFLEIDDETKDIPDLMLPRKLSKKKNLRVTFSDHIEVDLIEDLHDDIDEDLIGDFVVEETIYELVKSPVSAAKLSKGSAKFREALSIQSPKPVLIGQGSPEFNVTKDSVAPKSPPNSPRRSEQRLKSSPPKPNRSSTHSPPLLQKRRTSQSSMSESEKTPKEFLHARERRQPQHSQRSLNINTLFPSLGTNPKSRSQPNYSTFLSDAKRAVERANYVGDRPWSKRSPEKPVYGLYNHRNSDTQRSAGSVRKTASLPRNFRLPDTLYSGRYRRPGSDNTLLTANLGVK